MYQHYYNERIIVNDREFEARMYYDYDTGRPWEESDGHGPVRQIHRRDEKRPGERIMYSGERNACMWAYDVQAATVQAERDGWGLNDEAMSKLTSRLKRMPTKGEVLAAAVQADYEHLDGWVNDRWHWTGVAVLPVDENGDVDDSEEFAHSIWGIESGGDYWREVAEELAGEIIRADAVSSETAIREAGERAFWAERDVMTLGA